MVTLNKMTETEFNDFYNVLIRDYAQDNVKAGNWIEEESLEKSKKQVDNLIPDGIDTKGNYLFSIIEKGSTIGVLWVNIKENKLNQKHAFIYDIRINEKFRGKGFGKQTLQSMEDWLKSLNVKDVGLHVFSENTVAIKLYEKFGFNFTSHNMLKGL